MPHGFASDNCSPMHPEVLAALTAANADHADSYGADPLTGRVLGALRERFGGEALLVFNGSAANVLCMRIACRPWQAVICAAGAHVDVDEGGAPEAIAGVKLLTVDTPDGKLTPALVEARIERVGDEHAVQPRLVSITQSSELGTVYSPDELRALADHVHARDLLLHVDGARLSNAAAALGVELADVSTGAGADLVSFGGTKNGLMLGEAVIVADPALAQGTPYLRKQSLQLASKMRFLAAQFDAYLHDELWRRCASHANAMAARLAQAIGPLVELAQPVQANAVFARLPEAVVAPLQDRYPFHLWADGSARLMCAWDTTEQDVDGFAAALREQLGAGSPR